MDAKFQMNIALVVLLIAIAVGIYYLVKDIGKRLEIKENSGWTEAIATSIVLVVAFGLLAFAFGDCEWLTKKVPYEWPWTWIMTLGRLPDGNPVMSAEILSARSLQKFLVFGTLAAGYLIIWSTDWVKELSLGTTPFWILILIGFVGELFFRVIHPWATRLP
ncbi:MAG: hypothetical protein ABID45_03425 [Patescibacteria group bacterium]